MEIERHSEIFSNPVFYSENPRFDSRTEVRKPCDYSLQRNCLKVLKIDHDSFIQHSSHSFQTVGAT
jgi:hypothetical protein